ncbi:cytochrome c [Methyloligella sp. 2.7D]|uniref:cytochrome c n=1 Tax=unclassified Methyloligella TaxID=2625955 RepID=UPI00157D78ED|nr:cytochrome c [Methyloligella sp. GL2]QKP76232.1 cytochrome c [Methyloligella sp. GL2]
MIKTPRATLGLILLALTLTLSLLVSLPLAVQAADNPPALPTDFALHSESITLPSNFDPFPEGPGAEAMNRNCLTCHSASMVLYQPKLSEAQWEGIVDKMVDIFKAPLIPDDRDAILDYLTSFQKAE